MADRGYRGSKIVNIRINDETLAEIEAIVARSVIHCKEEPHTVSSWIKKQIDTELKHLKRGRKKTKKSTTVIPDLTDDEVDYYASIKY